MHDLYLLVGTQRTEKFMIIVLFMSDSFFRQTALEFDKLSCATFVMFLFYSAILLHVHEDNHIYARLKLFVFAIDRALWRRNEWSISMVYIPRHAYTHSRNRENVEILSIPTYTIRVTQSEYFNCNNLITPRIQFQTNFRFAWRIIGTEKKQQKPKRHHTDSESFVWTVNLEIIQLCWNWNWNEWQIATI